MPSGYPHEQPGMLGQPPAPASQPQPGMMAQPPQGDVGDAQGAAEEAQVTQAITALAQNPTPEALQQVVALLQGMGEDAAEVAEQFTKLAQDPEAVVELANQVLQALSEG